MPIANISSPYGGFQRRPETDAQRRENERRDEFGDYVFSRQTLTTTDEEAQALLAGLKLQNRFGVELQQLDRRSANRNAILPQLVAEKQKAYVNTDIEHLIDLQNARTMDVTS
ncbi:MAG: hypothetical protein FJX23_04300 [Alphaproteobacteria bacterium]|nr:hypothetical protein [Alphaproteobacteria bacterium]